MGSRGRATLLAACRVASGRVMTRHARRSVEGGHWLRGAGTLAALLAIAFLAAPAPAAKVKGVVTNFRELENPVWREFRQPKKRGFSFREPVPTVRADLRRLFPHIPKELCIAALAASPQKPPKPILIRVGGGRATPVTLVVPPGTQLQFQNTDPFKHRLYGVDISTFQPADTLRGATRDWTVPGPGTYEIRDQLAPSFRFWVVAEPNVVQSVYPNLKGDFALGLEPGQYTLQAFFAGQKVGAARPVTVEAADLDLSKEPLKVAPDPKKDDKKPEKDDKKAD